MPEVEKVGLKVGGGNVVRRDGGHLQCLTVGWSRLLLVKQADWLQETVGKKLKGWRKCIGEAEIAGGSVVVLPTPHTPRRDLNRPLSCCFEIRYDIN